MRSICISIFALTVAMAGCATQRDPIPTPSNVNQIGAIPAYLTETPSCALVIGGVGSSFADQKVGKVWYEVNRQITGYLHEILSKEGYRVVRFMAPPDSPAGEVINSVSESLARNRCNTFVQVSHQVDEDNDGRYFQISVAIQHLELNKDRPRTQNGTNTITVGDYNRDYRYPRTPYMLETFRTGTFANTAYDDLKKSGALVRIARGS